MSPLKNITIKVVGSPARKRTLDSDWNSCSEDFAPKAVDEKEHSQSLAFETVANSIVKNNIALIKSRSKSPPAGNSPSPEQQTPSYASPEIHIPSCASAPAMSPTVTTLTSGKPAAKRRKHSLAEKEAKAKAETAKKQEREIKSAAKVVEKARQDAQKKARQEEREQKRRAKEEAEQLKKAEVEKKKRAKEEEAKKARSHKPITCFFARKEPSSSEKQEDAVKKISDPDAASPAYPTPNSAAKNEELTTYHQVFRPFFVKDNVTLAASLVDDETREAKTRILDEYIRGEREKPEPSTAFSLRELRSFSCKRGCVYPSVRKLMAELEESESARPIYLTDSAWQNSQHGQARELLRKIPIKSIKFHEDIRPPYVGTITSLPRGVKSLRKLARKPCSRTILTHLNYDYDSEGEWQEDDGEDVDMDDDEEELDNEEEMDDFLDDSEEAGLARHAFPTDMEPESTGLCWEIRKQLDPRAQMYRFRLEFIWEGIDHHTGIDPFSTLYWEPEKSHIMVSPPAPSLSMRPPPTDAFQTLGRPGAPGIRKSQQLLTIDMQDKFRACIRAHPALSKVGIIELFASESPGVVKLQVKNSFELLAYKDGKIWKVRESSGKQS